MRKKYSADKPNPKNDNNSSSSYSYITCEYHKKSPFDLKPNAKMFESLKDCIGVLEKAFEKDFVCYTNDKQSIIFKPFGLDYDYCVSKLSQQSTDNNENDVKGC